MWSILAMMTCWTLAGSAWWLSLQGLKQNGRLLLRLETIEDYLEQIAESQSQHASSNGKRPLSQSRLQRDGLETGTPAPDFRLPRLDGGELSLSDYQGKQRLLVFSDPHCGPCDALMPDLETAARQRPEVQVLMVSRGDAAENRKKVQQHRLSFPIMLQRKWEISKLYAMFATPVAYRIDEDGRIAAGAAVGAEAILALLSQEPAQRKEAAPIG